VLAVGAGKSWIMVDVAKKYNRVVVLQPCLELVKQNHEKLANSGLNTTMIDSAHKGDWGADYIYTTPQTLCKNLHKCKEPDLVIIDECNVFYEGTMFDAIFKAWANCKVFGLTATPHYYRRRSLYKGGWVYSQTTTVSIEEVFGRAVVELDRKTLKSMGYGPDITITRTQIPVCKSEHIDNPVVYKKILDSHLIGVNNLLKTLSNGIVFCDSRKHAEWLSSVFNIPTIFGDTPKKKRIDLVERFNNGRIPFLLTVGCLVRGYDRQDLENIILLTNFNNASEFEQVLGRLNRGTCKKTCWYNGKINQRTPVEGEVELVKVRRIGG
jgi:superfamily II DNA or RNA helicase